MEIALVVILVLAAAFVLFLILRNMKWYRDGAERIKYLDDLDKAYKNRRKDE